MPLSKAKDKLRKRAERAVKRMGLFVQPKQIQEMSTLSNLNINSPVQPNLSKEAKLAKIKQIGEQFISFKPTVQPNTPVYNPAIHRPGDKVLVRQGKRLVPTIIPNLDADGQAIPW